MSTEKTSNTPPYLRLADMRTRYRVSGSTIWNWCHTTSLPAPVKLGANTSCWLLSELLEWEKTRSVTKSERS